MCLLSVIKVNCLTIHVYKKKGEGKMIEKNTVFLDSFTEGNILL